MMDTGVIGHVPENKRLGTDYGDGASALEGGPDDDLGHVYDAPGVVIEEPLG